MDIAGTIYKYILKCGNAKTEKDQRCYIFAPFSSKMWKFLKIYSDFISENDFLTDHLYLDSNAPIKW